MTNYEKTPDQTTWATTPVTDEQRKALCAALAPGILEETARNDQYGPHYNASPCHRMDPRVCVLAAGHDGECDDDEALMQFVRGGDGGRYG